MAGAHRYPKTRYVSVGDADVAYQIVGDGPLDLVVFYGLGSHVEMLWDWAAPFFDQLASFSRVGQGHPGVLLPLEEGHVDGRTDQL
jgi:hypothetical protein